MKTNKLISVFSVVMVAMLVMVTGCKSAIWSAILPQTQVIAVPAQTNVVTVVTTNTITETVMQTNVVIVQVTNSVTSEVTPTSQTQVQQVVTLTPVVTTNQVVTVAPAVYATQLDSTRIEAGVKDVGNVAGAVGVPFAGAGAAALAIIVHLVTAAYNKKQLITVQNSHGAAMDTAQAAISTLVGSIATIRAQLPTIYPQWTVKDPTTGLSLDDRFSAYLENAQNKAGPEVQQLISDLLDDHKDMVAVTSAKI